MAENPVIFPYFTVVEFFESFFKILIFFQFLQVWMLSVKLLEFVMVKKGRERRV